MTKGPTESKRWIFKISTTAVFWRNFQDFSLPPPFPWYSRAAKPSNILPDFIYSSKGHIQAEFVARKKPSKFISQQAKKVNGRFYIPKGVALQFLLPYFIIIIHRTCFNFKLLCFSGLQQDLSWGPTWVLSHGQGFGKAAEIQHYWYKR